MLLVGQLGSDSSDMQPLLFSHASLLLGEIPGERKENNRSTDGLELEMACRHATKMLLTQQSSISFVGWPPT